MPLTHLTLPRRSKRLDILLGRTAFHKGENTDARVSGPSEETLNEPKQLPLVEVKVSSHTASDLLAKAPCPAMREAWRHGHVMPEAAPRRLMIVEDDKMRPAHFQKDEGGLAHGWEALYKEGHLWWAQQARV